VTGLKRGICFGFLAALFAEVPAFAEMTQAALQQMYLDFLKSRDIQAEIAQNDDVVFAHSVQDYTFYYWIRIYDDDQTFFEIFTYDIVEMTAEQVADAFFAASRARSRVWNAKVCVNSRQDDIIFSAHALLTRPEDFTAVFDTLTACVDAALLDFLGEMPDIK
jgi:hypothetical protein